MSGECDKCGEHCLECTCNTVMISGCPICEKCNKYSIHCKCMEIKVEVGYESVVIDKMFGPQIFANLRVTADPSSNTWFIERQNIHDAEWVEWIRIPGQLPFEFKENDKE